MKIDIDKLIKLNALASKHFHKKHTIILPPGEKINFNNALGIEYDKGNWKLEDGLQEYVEILLKQKNLSDEMKVLMIFEKICKDYVYDDFRLLGDIYISLDKVKEQSELYGHSFLRELAFLSVHGLLHLLGYDHMKKEDEEVMFKKQDEILDGFGIKR